MYIGLRKDHLQVARKVDWLATSAFFFVLNVTISLSLLMHKQRTSLTITQPISQLKQNCEIWEIHYLHSIYEVSAESTGKECKLSIIRTNKTGVSSTRNKMYAKFLLTPTIPIVDTAAVFLTADCFNNILHVNSRLFPFIPVLILRFVWRIQLLAFSSSSAEIPPSRWCYLLTNGYVFKWTRLCIYLGEITPFCMWKDKWRQKLYEKLRYFFYSFITTIYWFSNTSCTEDHERLIFGATWISDKCNYVYFFLLFLSTSITWKYRAN